MTIDASPKKLASLLKRLRAKYPPTAEETPSPADAFDESVHEVVFSMLLWEAGSAQARAALKRLREQLVDFNELRVCMPDEIGHIIGEKYPRSAERSLRLRSVLTDVFRRCQHLSLAHLREQPKRDARAFLDALDGMPRFVSARVTLLTLDGHATPCDDRLRDLLVQERVVAASTSAEAAGSWLEHHIRAEDAKTAHAVLQAWSDAEGGVARLTKAARTRTARRGKKPEAKGSKAKARPGG